MRIFPPCADAVEDPSGEDGDGEGHEGVEDPVVFGQGRRVAAQVYGGVAEVQLPEEHVEHLEDEDVEGHDVEAVAADIGEGFADFWWELLDEQRQHQGEDGADRGAEEEPGAVHAAGGEVEPDAVFYEELQCDEAHDEQSNGERSADLRREVTGILPEEVALGEEWQYEERELEAVEQADTLSDEVVADAHAEKCTEYDDGILHASDAACQPHHAAEECRAENPHRYEPHRSGEQLRGLEDHPVEKRGQHLRKCVVHVRPRGHQAVLHHVVMRECEENAVDRIAWPGPFDALLQEGEGLVAILHLVIQEAGHEEEQLEMEEVHEGTAMSGMTENDHDDGEAFKYIPVEASSGGLHPFLSFALFTECPLDVDGLSEARTEPS